MGTAAPRSWPQSTTSSSLRRHCDTSRDEAGGARSAGLGGSRSRPGGNRPGSSPPGAAGHRLDGLHQFRRGAGRGTGRGGARIGVWATGHGRLLHRLPDSKARSTEAAEREVSRDHFPPGFSRDRPHGWGVRDGAAQRSRRAVARATYDATRSVRRPAADSAGMPSGGEPGLPRRDVLRDRHGGRAAQLPPRPSSHPHLGLRRQRLSRARPSRREAASRS